MAAKKSLKDPKVSIVDDLTPENYAILREVKDHPNTDKAWASYRGTVYAKTKRGDIVTINDRADISSLSVTVGRFERNAERQNAPYPKENGLNKSQSHHRKDDNGYVDNRTVRNGLMSRSMSGNGEATTNNMQSEWKSGRPNTNHQYAEQRLNQRCEDSNMTQKIKGNGSDTKKTPDGTIAERLRKIADGSSPSANCESSPLDETDNEESDHESMEEGQISEPGDE